MDLLLAFAVLAAIFGLAIWLFRQLLHIIEEKGVAQLDCVEEDKCRWPDCNCKSKHVKL